MNRQLFGIQIVDMSKYQSETQSYCTNPAIDESHETIVNLCMFEIQKADMNLSSIDAQRKCVS